MGQMRRWSHRFAFVTVRRPAMDDRPIPSREAWERVRSLFEAQAEARRWGFPEDKVNAVAAVNGMSIELQPVGAGEVIRPVLIYIDGEEAMFRD